MNFYELAQKLVMSVIAVALNTTVAVAGRMLPHRPDWLERVDALAAQFRAVAAEAAERAREPDAARRETGAARSDSAAETDNGPRPEQLLGAYNALWEFTQKVREQGLSLDEEFCTRVESEWTTSTLLGYLRALEVSLQNDAQTAQTAAHEYLAPGPRS